MANIRASVVSALRAADGSLQLRLSALKLPAVDHGRAAEHHGRRADVALPDAAIIELNAHAIGRIANFALVPVVN
jgi:hypothetical protein